MIRRPTTETHISIRSPERSRARRGQGSEDSDWCPRRGIPAGARVPMERDTDSPSTTGDEFEESADNLRESSNQELTDLLRSQIASLLDENEKLMVKMDDYREQIAVLTREKKESKVDPSAEQMALQTELGDARLREAELTVAFEELQHRIKAIDRQIETDPEMETFFNAVSISPTTLSRTQKSPRRSQSSRTSSPTTKMRSARDGDSTFDGRRSLYSADRRSPKRTPVQTPYTKKSPVKSSNYTSPKRSNPYSGNAKTESDNDNSQSSQRSGLDSPQSDSGCSLNSHTTSDGRDAPEGMNSFDEPETSKTEQQLSFRSQAPAAEVDEQMYGEDEKEFRVERPHGFISLLRRSRSTATEHPFSLGYHSELQSPTDQFYGRAADDTPTPTEGHLGFGTDGSGSDEGKGDRFSKLRASFRQSLGLGPAKPDFRMEAFAARQGEARALLSLRETRLELLSVQSRCQTLQRHVERLEAINTSRMEELESFASCERDLRQDIRNLQRRIFELEAEHREYKVNQRIKEMELMSKLAEANLRVSQAELSSEQASVWSELNKAHEAASEVLTPEPSRSGGGNGSTPSSATPSTPGSTGTASVLDIPPAGRLRTNYFRPNSHNNFIGRPPLERSVNRMDMAKRSSDQDTFRATDCTISCKDISEKERANDKPDGAAAPNLQQNQRVMDDSLGSLSDIRLQPVRWQ
ncbi:unnamed protein product [Calicophoron daubneyi]